MNAISQLRQTIEQKKAELARLKQMRSSHVMFAPKTTLTSDEKSSLAEDQFRAGAEAMMPWDPSKGTDMLLRADQINANRDARAQQREDKADAQAQSQKNDALTELANIDQNSPDAASEWSAIRNKWLTKNPKLEAYLPAAPTYIDAKGNFGKLAERGYADQLIKQAQSEKYLANSSTTSAERKQHLANAKEYEDRAKKYGASVADSSATGNTEFDKFMSGYDAKTKIPDALKSKWTPAEQKIITDHNNQVDQDKEQALKLAAGYENLEADKFNNEVNQTLGAYVEAAQKELETLKRGAISVQAAVKNNNQKGAAYMAMKKSLGDALSGSDFSGMAGFGVGEGLIGKVNEILGSAQITDEKAKSLVKSFVDGLNETINEYNNDVATKTETSALKEKIRNKFRVAPVKAISLGGTVGAPTPEQESKPGELQIPLNVKKMAKELGIKESNISSKANRAGYYYDKTTGQEIK